MSRKHCRRKHYALVNPITLAIEGAAITDVKLLDQLRIRELSAIESFFTGQATKDDWMTIADLLNISETLARDGVWPEALATNERAQEALAAAHARHTETGQLGMTGPQLQSLREAFGYLDAQRLDISRSRYEQAIKKTADRIRSAHPSVKVCI